MKDVQAKTLVSPRAPFQAREANPNWKGGRTVTPDGYVLVKVGIDHHLADVRGYAYEHRLVAEQMLGRRLKPGEEVHHGPGGKQENSPGNLTVMATRAEHRKAHRHVERGLRCPGDPNPDVECACGCMQELPRYDPQGRPRRFLPGHNPRESPVQGRILSFLSVAGHPCSPSFIAASIVLPVRAVTVALIKLADSGQITRVHKGIYFRKVR